LEWKALKTSNGKPNPEREKIVRELKRETQRQERLARMWEEGSPRDRAMIKTLQKLQKQDAKK
jgi:hypothetical protein